ncbi:hypothetical protein QOZ80_5AG0372460 [Eleusine coracana subsp. coracana]|nr:hypothetical protein QOZ80_5AG0372460 [Eleusine coracana subsp. coracana]
MSSTPPPLLPSEAPLPLSPLPADMQMDILSRVGDAASVVRCAATCKAWRRLIKEPGFLSHLHRRRRSESFDPSTLLGFFFRDTSKSLPRRRLYRRRPTRFLLLGDSRPQTSAPVVLSLSRFLTTVDDLDSFAPVASGDGGLVALCRFQCASRHTVGICVCNPLAGTSTLLPPLPSFFVPEKVVFLEADGTSFRLLTVMDDRQGTLVMRVFSSDSEDEDWDTPYAVELPDNMVVEIASPAVVHGGAVHWICGTPALPHALQVVAVHLTETGTSVSRFGLPPRAGVHRLETASRAARLVSSAQGPLSFILVDELVLSIWNLEDKSKQWSCCKAVYLMPMLPLSVLSGSNVELSIQGLCEKSGSLFFYVVGEGLFMLKLGTKKLVKVCKDHFTKYICPYVADFASCIRAMKSF